MNWDTLINRYPSAKLALADGSIFNGYAIGAACETTGEVVFNTAMTGYQEILTDPSYRQQIVTLTHPHIGNVGVNAHDTESCRVQAAGLVIRDLALLPSNWQSADSLDNYLKSQNVVAIAGIDTRRLTRLLRDKGAQSGFISSKAISDEEAVAKARAFPGLSGVDLAKVVSTPQVLEWNEPSFNLKGVKAAPGTNPRYHVVVYDFGVKSQILRLLVDRGCHLSLVPAKTPASEVLALKPDGILLSNGPGDPAACDYAVNAIRKLLASDVPLFGICLGFQLLALALNAKTRKMKFGHHGANHPVQDLETGVVAINSQNNGFVVYDRQHTEDI